MRNIGEMFTANVWLLMQLGFLTVVISLLIRASFLPVYNGLLARPLQSNEGELLISPCPSVCLSVRPSRYKGFNDHTHVPIIGHKVLHGAVEMGWSREFFKWWIIKCMLHTYKVLHGPVIEAIIGKVLSGETFSVTSHFDKLLQIDTNCTIA